MPTIEKVDTTSRQQVDEFVKLSYRLYKDVPQWVPPFVVDIKTMLDRNKHPFYEHADGEFLVARQDGQVVGRLAILENRSFNQYHCKKQAQFYLFECIDDQETANALFERGFEWARSHGLDEVVGPKGLSAFDGYGIQIEGTENRQMMTMMNYNFPYYQQLVENIGFTKEVDFVSCYMHYKKFKLPEKVKMISDRVRERGAFKVQSFANKRELKSWANRIGEAYNKTFVNNWEYYPLTEREIKFLLDNLLIAADPRLIKIITYKDDVVGFLLAFPDVSAALQRQKGRITPWGILDIMREMKKTQWVSLNGAGVLPEYHGRGGNALLYDEMENTIHNYNFVHAELTQVAETAVQMRQDLINLGGKAYKNHRVYYKKI